MNLNEFKLLLNLLSKPNYRATLAQVKPFKPMKATELQTMALLLRDRQFLETTEEIKLIKISDSGKALLKLDTTKLPITTEEKKILEACQKQPVKPSKIQAKPAKVRNQLIQELIERGLLEDEKSIKQITLSERGKHYLATEYQPIGSKITISSQKLAKFLSFLRDYFAINTGPTVVINGEKPNDEEVFQAIKNLDRELGTDNYLPIFHLRSKFQPPLTRDELNQAIYRLQRQDKLELSSLVEAINYTNEQIQAGIPQDMGGPLFFLMIN